MGFSWSYWKSGAASTGDAADPGDLPTSEAVNEIYQNIQHIYSDLTHCTALSYTWSQLPVSDGGFINAATIEDLRNGLDTAYNNNVCPDYTYNNYDGDDGD